MRSYLLLNATLLLGVAACELKITPDDSDTSADSTGPATTSDSGGTDGQTSNSGGSSVGTATDPTATATSATATTATATATTDATTGMTSSTTSATETTTTATSGTTSDPVDPQPCAGDPKEAPGVAIAYIESQVPPNPDTTGGGSSGTSGGDPPDPQTLHIRLSSQTFTCADPAANLQCGPNWEVSITIPPEFQTPGLYHLSGPSVFGGATETGADEGGNMCSFGGGSFWATFELVAIDDAAVTGRLCHIDSPIPFNAAELEGVQFVAPRCP